ncbi:MAG TPA: pyridoxal phosphate-dependent aminotransferase [Candidatus Copromorpha excrementigallinarum]|uniref:Aminotransferase n=1 Tax=Candidatus Allocopromorpha excrementigallinarum TaxID=2840742 RepID=A0A9D1I2C7_9FIRM|nr:pyridoxal phosphate-dependent aminotransferase [Candidatus Copromorpha excrementigallinarum]
MKLSQKVAVMQHSPIRKFNRYAREAEEKGIKVYRLNIGQPDVKTPECFMEAVKSFDEKIVAYAESEGTESLQRAISEYFKRYGIDFKKEEIMVTDGGSEALSMIFHSILDEGDEVLIAEPFYTNYHNFVTAAGGKIVPLTAKAEDGYDYAKKELIEGAITEKTRAICCTSPGNPTGRVLSEEDMRLIGELAQKHDLWIISDEVYREFVYDGKRITSFGAMKEFSDRVIIADSISKRFSACGARIGCIASKNPDITDAIMKLAQGRLSSPTLEQVGAAALYGLGNDYYNEVVEEYRGRRDAAYEELMKIPGAFCLKPAGAFYMMARLPVADVEDFLMFLLTQFEDRGETVMFAPAEGFYATPGLGKDEMRIAYVLNRDDMRRGVELIRLGIEKYNGR